MVQVVEVVTDRYPGTRFIWRNTKPGGMLWWKWSGIDFAYGPQILHLDQVVEVDTRTGGLVVDILVVVDTGGTLI